MSVEKTINYAKFFNSHLTREDLSFWLISPQTQNQTVVNQLLTKNPRLKKQIISKNNKSYKKRLRLTNKKIKSIQKLTSTLKFIPTIKLVALTGSLSINNPRKNDDIDLMIVTSPNTLWLTRPIVALLVSLISTRRKPDNPHTNNQVCLNLWLDQTSLLIPKKKQNLYTAHEALQIKPLLDKGEIHHQFILANSWAKKYLANAYQQISHGKAKVSHRTEQISPRMVAEAKRRSPPRWNLIKQLLRGGTRSLNSLAFKLQYLYMKKKITNEHITTNSAYFHPRNLYPEIKKTLQT